MPSLTGCYRKTPGLRVRPVPEWDRCIVFTPAAPKLYTLNLSAWLVFELFADAPAATATRAYLAATVPPESEEAARRNLDDCLRMLQDNGILEWCAD